MTVHPAVEARATETKSGILTMRIMIENISLARLMPKSKSHDNDADGGDDADADVMMLLMILLLQLLLMLM